MDGLSDVGSTPTRSTKIVEVHFMHLYFCAEWESNKEGETRSVSEGEQSSELFDADVARKASETPAGLPPGLH